MSKTKIYFVITIDTEADHSPDWTKSDPLTFNSVIHSIPGSLEPLFKEYGAIATYLLTTEVLEDANAVDVIKKLNGCELGTHLHPEYIEPDKKFMKYKGTYSTEFSNNLDAGIEKNKLDNLTKLFEEKIGYRPVVYRGGKFGFSENTALSLAGLGYLVDTSVTPRVSWRNIGGPDFRKLPDQPYFIKDENKKNLLLEVPVSIMFTNVIYRLLNRPVWLRPSFNSPAEMKSLILRFIRRHASSGILVLNMMFHSMEFYPGASPYSRNQEDCDRLIDRVDFILKYCGDIGVEFCKLSHTRALYENKS